MTIVQHLYLIGLGSNLGERQGYIEQALESLQRSGARVIAKSPLYESEPLLHPDHPTLNQSNFLNAAASVESELQPHEFLSLLQSIETETGRERRAEDLPWAPRKIDMDILACGDTIISDQALSIPHPQLQMRDFVLVPLSDIASDWQHPILKKTVKELLDDLGETNGLRLFAA